MRTITAAAALVLLAAAPAAAEDVVTEPSPAPTAAEGVQVPDFKTKSWIVVDAESGDVLAGQNYREQRPMASTLKTLTSLTLLPRLQYDSVYEAKPNETLTEGAHVGVLAGNQYTVEQLFHGMLMRSGNDAAVALADAYGYQRTIDAMNAEAARIGATATHAESPNGLDRPGQVTTAADLAQIYRVAIQDPRLQEILTVKKADFPGRPPIQPTDARGSYAIYNHDSLLSSGYAGFLGGKSGFTSQAGRTYVAGADQNGRKVVVALLGIGGGTTETARQVLDWSFANIGSLQPIEQLPQVGDTPQVQAVAAGSGDPQDLAPMPPDPQTAATMTAVAQQAQAAAQQAVDGVPDVPGPEDIAQDAIAAADEAVAQADQSITTTAQTVAQDAIAAAALAAESVPTPADPQTVAQDAIAAADAAAVAAGLTDTTTTTTVVAGGPGAAIGSAAMSDPTAVAAPAEQQPAPQRGFFASLLAGLFKAFMWTLLFLGIAVVLLRIRAVRRQRARREAYLEATRQRVAENLPEDSTFRRDPVRTR